jgi:hypothetical protein
LGPSSELAVCQSGRNLKADGAAGKVFKRRTRDHHSFADLGTANLLVSDEPAQSLSANPKQPRSLAHVERMRSAKTVGVT